MYDQWEEVGLPNIGTIGHLGFSAVMRTPRGEKAGWKPGTFKGSQWLDSSLLMGSLSESLGAAKRWLKGWKKGAKWEMYLNIYINWFASQIHKYGWILHRCRSPQHKNSEPIVCMINILPIRLIGNTNIQNISSILCVTNWAFWILRFNFYLIFS